MEEEVSIFTTTSIEPVVSTISLGSFFGEISVTTTRIDKSDDSGAGLFYVDVSISDSIPSFGSYNILSSSESSDFISLTDTKGNTWTGNPMGVVTTESGYNMILEEVGKKSTTYSEIAVSSGGEVSKKGTSITTLQFIESTFESFIALPNAAGIRKSHSIDNNSWFDNICVNYNSYGT